MVFHRYLVRRLRILRQRSSSPALGIRSRFSIRKPGRFPVNTWATRSAPVNVTGHILPQRRYLTDEQYESAGGPGGWLEQQGFYVYRRDDSSAAGGWLGLPGIMRVEERCALA